VWNRCQQDPVAEDARRLAAAACADIAADNVWDVHCHVFGNGDSGSGLWSNPAMERMWPLPPYVRRAFYVNASCAREDIGSVDASVVDRLVLQCAGMPAGFRALIFAFDWARDEQGRPSRERSTFHVPDEYCAQLAARYPSHFRWAASIHPYDPAALDRLDAAIARGACAVKWLPSAQGIDPASSRCDPFYQRLAQARLPLITHAGDEHAVEGFAEGLGNPLRLRRPLDAGVRVVIAHCASLGEGDDIERGGRRANFELFARLMDEPRYASTLAGDISSVTQANRLDVVVTLLGRRDWHSRLLNGSDYPLPGVVPLVSLPRLAAHGLIDPQAVAPLAQLRNHNVLLFDFVLKRSLGNNGAGFARSVFETRPFFEASV
jgi:uncharacterized protein